jgi:hypothetical protein
MTAMQAMLSRLARYLTRQPEFRRLPLSPGEPIRSAEGRSISPSSKKEPR